MPGKCTIIKCTMGPMEKDDQLLFKVKSRIFTETLIKVGYFSHKHIIFKNVFLVLQIPFDPNLKEQIN